MSNSIGTLDEAVAVFMKIVADASAENKALFAGMQSNFDGMQSNFDGMQSNFDGMQSNFDGMQSRFDGMQSRFDGMQSRFDGMQSKFDAQLVDLKGDFYKLSEKLDDLQRFKEKTERRLSARETLPVVPSVSYSRATAIVEDSVSLPTRQTLSIYD